MRKVFFVFLGGFLSLISQTFGADFNFNDLSNKDILEKYTQNVNSAYESSSLKGRLTQEQYEKIFGSYSQVDNTGVKTTSKGSLGTVFTIDSHNQKSCKAIQHLLIKSAKTSSKLMQDPLASLNDMCRKGYGDERFVSVTLFGKDKLSVQDYLAYEERRSAAQYKNYVLNNKNKGRPDVLSGYNLDSDGYSDSGFSGWETFKKNSVGFIAGAAVIMGALYALPEDISGWERDEFGFSEWEENVKSGPVRDEDGFLINFVGHPISGAGYHIVARHAGASGWEAFGFSVMMSTVFWEYGIEALIETPSIQDLIFTPVIGSLIGEAFIALEKRIESNDGKLFGSEGLGSFVGIFLDPFGPFINYVNESFGTKLIESIDSRIVTSQRPLYFGQFDNEVENNIGIVFEIKF